MSNIAHSPFVPDWRQLCQAALFETNPVTLLERIDHARNAVLDRIEDGYTKPLNGEEHDLRDALNALESLRRVTERQNGYQRLVDCSRGFCEWDAAAWRERQNLSRMIWQPYASHR
jgi:hypothetical protein